MFLIYGSPDGAGGGARRLAPVAAAAVVRDPASSADAAVDDAFGNQHGREKNRRSTFHSAK